MFYIPLTNNLSHDAVDYFHYDKKAEKNFTINKTAFYNTAELPFVQDFFCASQHFRDKLSRRLFFSPMLFYREFNN